MNKRSTPDAKRSVCCFQAVCGAPALVSDGNGSTTSDCGTSPAERLLRIATRSEHWAKRSTNNGSTAAARRLPSTSAMTLAPAPSGRLNSVSRGRKPSRRRTFLATFGNSSDSCWKASRLSKSTSESTVAVTSTMR